MITKEFLNKELSIVLVKGHLCMSDIRQVGLDRAQIKHSFNNSSENSLVNYDFVYHLSQGCRAAGLPHKCGTLC